MFGEQELSRYQRHLSLPGFGLSGQQKLKNARVLIVGAGGLGCPAAQYLAAAGIGTLGLIDHDSVEMSNLQRQILYSENNIGTPKVEVAAQKIKQINPFTKVSIFKERLTFKNATSILKPFDIILDGSDNFKTRYLVNDACVLLDKPFVFGSILKFEGQVSVFNYKGGPTYRCLFPNPPAPNTTSNCSDIGVLGVLPGIIGTLQAAETLKIAAEIGTTLSGKLLIWDILTLKPRIIAINSNYENFQKRKLDEINDSYSQPEERQRTIPVPTITPVELKTLLEDKAKIQLIDVREDWENQTCKFNLYSTSIPLSKIETHNLSGILTQLDLNKKIILYCKSGHRSETAAQILIQRIDRQHHNIYILKGGIRGWKNTEDPSMPVY